MMLRAFVNCYEMDILDEHAFLQWKEDVNDTYPGKGKALFQVNSQGTILIQGYTPLGIATVPGHVSPKRGK
jgi:translation initiation factor 4G